jgi:tRNA A-37 threonylcarbamoyl transferase component Bud32
MRRAPINREEFESGAGANLSPERWYKPEVRPVTVRGVPCLVKDFRRRPLPWRLTVGRFVIEREATIYRALRGVPGVPRFFGQFDADSFLVARIDGRDLSTFRKKEISPDFIDRLGALVSSLHARGVVHWDLRQRKNILVDRGGAPWLIDFASSVRFPRGSCLLRWAGTSDRSGVAKLREKYAPETLTDEDRALLALDRLRPFRRARKTRRAEAKAKRKAERQAAKRRRSATG